MAFKRSKQSISKEAMFSKIMPSLKTDDEEIIEETPAAPPKNTDRKADSAKNTPDISKHDFDAELVQKVTEEFMKKNSEPRKPKFTKEELEKTLNEIFGNLPQSDSEKEITVEKTYTPEPSGSSNNTNEVLTFDKILEEASAQQNNAGAENVQPQETETKTSDDTAKQAEAQPEAILETQPETPIENTEVRAEEPEPVPEPEPVKKTVAPQKIVRPVQVNPVSEQAEEIPAKESETPEPVVKKATVTPKVVRPVPVNSISVQAETTENITEKSEESKDDIAKRRTGRGRVRKSKTNDEKPVSNEQNEETEVINLNEELVISRFDEIFRKFNCCHCNSCRFNIMAGILNEIPANYVTIKKSEREKTIAEADDSKIRPTIIQAVLKNMIKPNH